MLSWRSIRELTRATNLTFSNFHKKGVFSTKYLVLLREVPLGCFKLMQTLKLTNQNSTIRMPFQAQELTTGNKECLIKNDILYLCPKPQDSNILKRKLTRNRMHKIRKIQLKSTINWDQCLTKNHILLSHRSRGSSKRRLNRFQGQHIIEIAKQYDVSISQMEE